MYQRIITIIFTLIGIIVTGFFIPSDFVYAKPSEQCNLVWMAFYTEPMESTLLLQKQGGYVEIVVWPSNIQNQNCSGWKGELSLSERGGFGGSVIGDALLTTEFDFENIQPGEPYRPTRIAFQAGENKCKSSDTPQCIVEAKIVPKNDSKTGDMLNTRTEVISRIWRDIEPRYNIKYNCITATCDDDILWKKTTLQGTLDQKMRVVADSHEPPKTSGCFINYATFNPATPPVLFYEKGISGSSIGKTTVTIQTKNCDGKEIDFSIKNYALRNSGESRTTPKNIRNQKIKIGPEEKVTLTLKTGEDNCDRGTYNGGNCQQFIEIKTPDHGVWSSRGRVSGNFDYNCSTGAIINFCSNDTAWKILSCDPVSACKDMDTFQAEPVAGLTTPDPACVQEDGTVIQDCYQFYGGLGEIGTTLQGNTNEKVNLFQRFTPDQGIGGVINAIIAFATGIAGIILVVRIFFLGFEYMQFRKEGAPTKLTDTKNKIWKAVIGFILLLCIFIILRTINPDLLNLAPRVDSILFNVPTDQDVDSFIESQIQKSPDVAKIYAPVKKNQRDGGTLQPATESSRRAMAESIPASSLVNLRDLGINVKTGTGLFVEKGLGNKLQKLNNSLKQKNVTSFIITEGFKPSTYKHFAACHYKATCVDADIPVFNAEQVALVISEASKHGLVAVWETKNEKQVAALEKLNVPAGNIILFRGNHITGDHFSIYDRM